MSNTNMVGLSRPLSYPLRPHLDDDKSKEYIDIDGDLCLDIGHGSALFVVCSKSLARSSRFWKRLLYGQFKEGLGREKPSEWVVELPEDDPEAMRTVLNIVHCRFDQITDYDEDVDVMCLLGVCVLTDKYDMTHLLRPWATGWSRNVNFECNVQGDTLRDRYSHERLWIAWELGDIAEFKELARFMLLNCSFATGQSLYVDDVQAPPGIYENIENARLEILKDLFESLEGRLDSLVTPDQEHDSETVDCAALMYGKAAQTLYKLQLWPWPQGEKVPHSLAHIVKKLLAIDWRSAHTGKAHEACAEYMRRAWCDDVINAVYPLGDNKSSLLSDEHRRHLDIQSKKSGFYIKDADTRP
ncbi:hypothetical protein GGR54DRAFT_644123 [Hypoxylon sp. NC1633]|nr:hypothetical protein GGR54DRAFT_644123 [Hypoxylon sp. NC1633]